MSRAETAASRGLDTQPVARRQVALGLGRDEFAVHGVLPFGAVFATVPPSRGVAPALGYQREAHGSEGLELANDAVAAAALAGAPTTPPDRELADPNRQLALEGLDGRVQR